MLHGAVDFYYTYSLLPVEPCTTTSSLSLVAVEGLHQAYVRQNQNLHPHVQLLPTTLQIINHLPPNPTVLGPIPQSALLVYFLNL